MLEDARFDATTVWTAKDALKLLQSQYSIWYCWSTCRMLNEIMDCATLRALGARAVVCKYAYPQILETVGKFLAGDRALLAG